MQRAGNRFGAAYLADLLMGVKTEKIEANGHDKLPTFGVGADKSKLYWKYLIQALVTQGAATLSSETRLPVPQVAALGWEVMRGKRKITILKRPEPRTKKKPVFLGATRDPYDKSALQGRERRLFDALRALRAKLARAENAPPYVVFSDKTLVDMALLKPQSPGEFLLVQGVGRAKLVNYGEEFMDAIREFLRENPT